MSYSHIENPNGIPFGGCTCQEDLAWLIKPAVSTSSPAARLCEYVATKFYASSPRGAPVFSRENFMKGDMSAWW